MPFLAIAAQRGGQCLIDLDIVRVDGRPLSGLTSQQHIVAPYDDRPIGVRRRSVVRTNGTHLDRRKALALVGRLELALIAKLHRR